MADGRYINIYALVLKSEPNNIKYIGVTRRNPKYRLASHLYDAKHFPLKTGKTKWISDNNFEIEQIILDIIEEDNIDFWEKHWISLIKSWGFELVNSNSGGGGLNKRSEEFSIWLSNRSKGNKYNLGKNHSIETKQKLSKIRKECIGPNKGKKFDENWKNKLSKAKIGTKGNATGYKHSEASKNLKRKAVLQLDIDGNLIKEWIGIREAAKTLSINENHITSVCRGRRKTTGGFKWKYKENV